MLIEFSVENCLSFKDKVTFSMLANEEDCSNKDNLVYSDILGQNVLRNAVIYGANASGKSNILKALASIRHTILSSHETLPNNTITSYQPFLLDQTYISKPAKFEIIFLTNKTKYAYGFTYNANAFIEEYLYYWQNNQQKTIFERTDGIYEFEDTSDEPQTLANRTKNNTLFLTASNQWNYEPTKDPFDWIYNFLFIDYFKEKNILTENLKYKIKTDNNFKQLILSYLHNIADIGIIDLKINDRDRIETIHKCIANNSIQNISFDLYWESDGTQVFIHLLNVLLIILEKNATILFDEINLHLHPHLTNFIIELFNNPKSNPHNAQLIFTTHDVNQLDLKKFRKDQIYFTEKNPETGSSDLYSLDEIDGVQDNENIRKGYLQGRYGAIPIIGNAHLSWQKDK